MNAKLAGLAILLILVAGGMFYVGDRNRREPSTYPDHRIVWRVEIATAIALVFTAFLVLIVAWKVGK